VRRANCQNSDGDGENPPERIWPSFEPWSENAIQSERLAHQKPSHLFSRKPNAGEAIPRPAVRFPPLWHDFVVSAWPSHATIDAGCAVYSFPPGLAMIRDGPFRGHALERLWRRGASGAPICSRRPILAVMAERQVLREKRRP
jgi:hypothetical protein